MCPSLHSALEPHLMQTSEGPVQAASGSVSSYAAQENLNLTSDLQRLTINLYLKLLTLLQ